MSAIRPRVSIEGRSPIDIRETWKIRKFWQSGPRYVYPIPNGPRARRVAATLRKANGQKLTKDDEQRQFGQASPFILDLDQCL